jgi:hypothetical protein
MRRMRARPCCLQPNTGKKTKKTDFISDPGIMQTGGGICKRKSCGSTSDDGRSKRTRKTTKGDGFEQDTGASQRRIQGADTDNLSGDGGSKESSSLTKMEVTVALMTTLKSTAASTRCTLGKICANSMTELSKMIPRCRSQLYLSE